MMYARKGTALVIEPEQMEVATVATGCQNCDHETEFHGIVIDDIAYFPCPLCKTVFVLGTMDGWSHFFDEDEDEDN